MPERFKLSDEEHERIFSRLELFMLSQSKERASPTVAILGGQPGAGKTNLIRIASRTLFSDDKYVIINGDEYRQNHPGIKEMIRLDDKKLAALTDPDVRVWTKRLFDSAIAHRRDIIFEGTMRNKEPIMETISHMKQAGYRIHVFALAVPDKVSRIGILTRYEKQKESMGFGRWTPPASHNEAYVNMPHTIEEIEKQGLIDRISIYNRGGELLYSNNGSNHHEGKHSILRERQRSLTQEEINLCRAECEYVKARLKAREATPDEKKIYMSMMKDLEKNRNVRER